MDELVALGRYGAETVLMTRDGEIVDKATHVLLLFKPRFEDMLLLQKPDVKVYDLAELWAFVNPTQNAPPTLFGLIGSMPKSVENSAILLFRIYDDLMDQAKLKRGQLDPYLAWLEMGGGAYRWPWLDHLDWARNGVKLVDILDITQNLNTGQNGAKELNAIAIEPSQLRSGQQDYYHAIKNFLGSESSQNRSLVARGGTGVGKTRAYLAAARGGEAVWVSTFTKALQTQVQSEAQTYLGLKTAVRKGRDNYLCLKIFKAAFDNAPNLADGRQRVAMMTMLRWVAATQDGDVTGADFPAWIAQLYGAVNTSHMTDRFRECNYNACPFYDKCFAEVSKAEGAGADLVVTNHAMIASLMQYAPHQLPETLIMDEAHHVANVMDDRLTTGFSRNTLLAMERFLLGRSGQGGQSKRRGFLESLKDYLPKSDAVLLRSLSQAAQILAPSSAFYPNIKAYIDSIHDTVLAYQNDTFGGFDWDAPRDLIAPPAPDIVEALQVLFAAAHTLIKTLEKRDRDAAQLNNEPFISDPKMDLLERAVLLPIRSWLTQFEQLGTPIPDDVIEYAGVKRLDGHVIDIGLFRTMRDPLKAWDQLSAPYTNKIIYTTATKTHELDAISQNQIGVNSPFDYINNSKIIILQDIDINRPSQMATAIDALAGGSGGGAMAIFTAINNLKQTHAAMRPLAKSSNLNLLAQHAGDGDIGTLVDIFKTEPRSVLLGTDSVRDGIDIAGDALRLVIMDRVPWSRPALVHKERQKHHGGRDYEEDMVRYRLAQAFGRLIRTENDRGVFVMLDKRLPSRLFDAFPNGISIEKLTLNEAVQRIKEFL